MKTHHTTKGPWLALEDRRNENNFLDRIVITAPNSGRSFVCDLKVDDDFDIANAHLIAAAPNLLESCEKILEILAEFEAKKDQAKIVTALRFAIDYAGIEKSIKKAKDEL